MYFKYFVFILNLCKIISDFEFHLHKIKKLKAQLDEKTKIGMTEKAANSDTILENGMEVQVIDVQSKSQIPVFCLMYIFAYSV